MNDTDDAKIPLDEAVAALRPFLGLSDLLPSGVAQAADVPIMHIRAVLRGLEELRPYAEADRQLADGEVPAACAPYLPGPRPALAPLQEDAVVGDAAAIAAAVRSLRLISAIAVSGQPPFRVSTTASAVAYLADWLEEWGRIARDEDCGADLGAAFARAWLASTRRGEDDAQRGDGS